MLPITFTEGAKSIQKQKQALSHLELREWNGMRNPCCFSWSSVQLQEPMGSPLPPSLLDQLYLPFPHQKKNIFFHSTAFLIWLYQQILLQWRPSVRADAEVELVSFDTTIYLDNVFQASKLELVTLVDFETGERFHSPKFNLASIRDVVHIWKLYLLHYFRSDIVAESSSVSENALQFSVERHASIGISAVDTLDPFLAWSFAYGFEMVIDSEDSSIRRWISIDFRRSVHIDNRKACEGLHSILVFSGLSGTSGPFSLFQQTQWYKPPLSTPLVMEVDLWGCRLPGTISASGPPLALPRATQRIIVFIPTWTGASSSSFSPPSPSALIHHKDSHHHTQTPIKVEEDSDHSVLHTPSSSVLEGRMQAPSVPVAGPSNARSSSAGPSSASIISFEDVTIQCSWRKHWVELDSWEDHFCLPVLSPEL
ncbi:hypothetical protein M422DRAFT_263309 [Sphaerobolus stellatus SS14]|uniref:Uncharacterized protein n=1 Tax=Sphaerobolus stellatus (strain SS14) TaxID=990650 RepID=A0A0C9VAL3_SPHS4|nr:hypothetical protein M422DRAFT_263309 [Sphaerobolus stellatus SS14]